MFFLRFLTSRHFWDNEWLQKKRTLGFFVWPYGDPARGLLEAYLGILCWPYGSLHGDVLLALLKIT